MSAHDQNHSIVSTDNHAGVGGATLNHLIAFDGNGLPGVDSGFLHTDVFLKDGSRAMSGNLTIGIAAAGVDYKITFDGENSDGVITWDEDNAKFLFDHTIELTGDLRFVGGAARAIYHDTNSFDLNIGNASNATALVVDSTGKIGINKADPAKQLDVDGTIGATGQITSTLAIGTSPFNITSTTVNTNLNADLWDGYQFADYLDQAVKQASSPTFAGMTLTGFSGAVIATAGVLSAGTLGVTLGGTGATTLTQYSLLLGNGTSAISALGAATNGQIPIGSSGASPVLATITGTASQITVTNAAGSITLSTPQDIATTSSPTFAGLTITNAINEFSTDGTLGDNSDTALPTEKAVKTYVDNQIAGVNTFIELTDTPGSYTTANAIYTTNGTPDAVIETTVVLTEAANTFNITKGTASLDIAAGAALNIDVGLQVITNAGTLAFTAGSKTLSVEDTSIVSQDYSTDGTPQFGKIGIGVAAGTEEITLNGDFQFTNAANRTIDVADVSGVTGKNLTVKAGDTDTETAGSLYLKAGSDGGGGQNGNVYIHDGYDVDITAERHIYLDAEGFIIPEMDIQFPADRNYLIGVAERSDGVGYDLTLWAGGSSNGGSDGGDLNLNAGDNGGGEGVDGDINHSHYTNCTFDNGIDVTGNITVTGNVDGVDVAALASDVNGFPDELKNLVTAEIQQLEAIGATTISAGQWGYLGNMDQDVISTSNVVFGSVTVNNTGKMKLYDDAGIGSITAGYEVDSADIMLRLNYYSNVVGRYRDFRIYDGQTTEILFIDGSSKDINITSDDVSITSATSAKPVLKIENTNSDANGGIIRFNKVTTGRDVDDQLGWIDYNGNDDSDTLRSYGMVDFRSSSIDSEHAAGKFIFDVLVDDTHHDLLIINGYNGTNGQAQIIFNEDSVDCDMRWESNGNANGMCWDAGEGSVSVGLAAPTDSKFSVGGIIKGYGFANSNTQSVSVTGTPQNVTPTDGLIEVSNTISSNITIVLQAGSLPIGTVIYITYVDTNGGYTLDVQGQQTVSDLLGDAGCTFIKSSTGWCPVGFYN